MGLKTMKISSNSKLRKEEVEVTSAFRKVKSLLKSQIKSFPLNKRALGLPLKRCSCFFKVMKWSKNNKSQKMLRSFMKILISRIILKSLNSLPRNIKLRGEIVKLIIIWMQISKAPTFLLNSIMCLTTVMGRN